MNVKNLYRCPKCKAQMIVQNPRGNITPFMLRCRAPDRDSRSGKPCGGDATSTMYSLSQDVLGSPHLEFIYEGGTSGEHIIDVKALRPVPAFEASFP